MLVIGHILVQRAFNDASSSLTLLYALLSLYALKVFDTRVCACLEL